MGDWDLRRLLINILIGKAKLHAPPHNGGHPNQATCREMRIRRDAQDALGGKRDF
jgi:hypothetical protein